MSDTTLLFLKEASRKREFQVMTMSRAPRAGQLGGLLVFDTITAVPVCDHQVEPACQMQQQRALRYANVTM
jgi:hypothetical protein